MTVERVAQRHAARQVALARRTAGELAKLWRMLDLANIAGSWRSLLPRALAVVATSQATAAASAGLYVDNVLEAYGMDIDAAGQVSPAAFAGVASDGRDLAQLMYRPVVTTLTQIGQGATTARAVASGRFALDMISRTQVADAGRTADGVAIVARPQLKGYVRMVVGKTCPRCLILAGRTYRWNAGFKRHPRCDCRHIPVAEDVPDDIRTDPGAYFRSLSESGQDDLLGKAGAEAVRAGADMAQVVNARRGMQEARVYGRNVLITTEGTTTRGVAGRRLGAAQTGEHLGGNRYRTARAPRLMPEQILAEAKGDRQEAVRLLRRFGYIH